MSAQEDENPAKRARREGLCVRENCVMIWGELRIEPECSCRAESQCARPTETSRSHHPIDAGAPADDPDDGKMV